MTTTTTNGAASDDEPVTGDEAAGAVFALRYLTAHRNPVVLAALLAALQAAGRHYPLPERFAANVREADREAVTVVVDGDGDDHQSVKVAAP